VSYFFFSYSRADAPDQHLYNFYDDLCRELSVRAGIPIDETGFIDKHQPFGAEWDRTMSQAVATCKVFVPVYSPNYMVSRNCVQEWVAFAARLESHRRLTGESLDCVVPVWWIPVDDLAPKLGWVEDPRVLFGANHEKHGLRFLLRLRDLQDQYRDAVVSLAMMINDAGKRPPKQEVLS